MTTAPQMLTLRPATWNDLNHLVDLMVQLYNAEIPGVLRAPPEAQRALFRYLVGESGVEGLRGRYVADDADGAVVASASLRFYHDPDGPALPAGTVGAAVRNLGPAGALRLFGSMLRASLNPETRLEAYDVYIHSVVVAESRRGTGLGRSLMEAVEAVARRRGARTAILRVVVGNDGARRLYERLGYRVVSATPALVAPFTYPTQTMAKSLQQGAL